jgi:hypothetical protein
VRFFGMGENKDYLAYKVIKDKLLTLTKTNELQIWDLIGG